jgi:hypothetical protein
LAYLKLRERDYPETVGNNQLRVIAGTSGYDLGHSIDLGAGIKLSGIQISPRRFLMSPTAVLSETEVLVNQKTILENQALILKNQEEIKKNQKALNVIVTNQEEIKKNQEKILAAVRH